MSESKERERVIKEKDKAKEHASKLERRQNGPAPLLDHQRKKILWKTLPDFATNVRITGKLEMHHVVKTDPEAAITILLGDEDSRFGVYANRSSSEGLFCEGDIALQGILLLDSETAPSEPSRARRKGKAPPDFVPSKRFTFSVNWLSGALSLSIENCKVFETHLPNATSLTKIGFLAFSCDCTLFNFEILLEDYFSFHRLQDANVSSSAVSMSTPASSSAEITTTENDEWIVLNEESSTLPTSVSADSESHNNALNRNEEEKCSTNTGGNDSSNVENNNDNKPKPEHAPETSNNDQNEKALASSS